MVCAFLRSLEKGKKIFDLLVCQKRPVHQNREEQAVLTQLLNDDPFLGHIPTSTVFIPSQLFLQEVLMIIEERENTKGFAEKTCILKKDLLN
jgi:hypothetical protein